MAALVVLALAFGAVPALASQFHPYEASVGTGEVNASGGLAVDSDGNLYAIDRDAGKVFKYSAAGAPANFSALGSNVLGSFGFNVNSELAIDASGGVNDGHIYVTDSKNGAIRAFQASGAPASFSASASYIEGNALKGGPDGAFGYACGVAVDPNGAIYVSDQNQAAVRIYSPSGQFLTQTSIGNVCGLAVDSGGTLYVNSNYGPIARLTPSTFPVTASTTYDSAVQVSQQNAFGLAVDPANDHLFVAATQYPGGPGEIVEYDSVAGGGAQVGRFGAERLSGLNGVAVDRSGGVNDGKIYAGAPGRVDRFGTAVTVPDAATGASSAVTSTTATIAGTINPLGTAASYQFEYGTDTSYGQKTPAVPASVGNDNSNHALSANLTGLAPETTYYFRVVGINSNGSNSGQDASFTTPSAVKAVNTGVATNLTQTGATVHGMITPGGITLSDCKFEYGTSEALGQSAPCAEGTGSIGSGEASPVPVHADLTGLSAGRYYFRLVASNAFGTTLGGMETMGIPGPPLLLGQSAGSEAFRVSLNARISPRNAATTYYFEYGPTAGYGETTEATAIAAGNDPVRVAQEVKELQASTTYHFRTIVANAYGTVEGADQTFTTDSAPAAGPCPNAPIRAEQGAIGLPECRAYEVVSPQDKLGLGVFNVPNTGSLTSASPDGTATSFQSTGAFADAQVGRTLNDYVSRRGPDGWTTHSISNVEYVNGQIGSLSAGGWSEDLSHAAVFSDGLPENPIAPGGAWYENTLYLNDLQSGVFRTVTLDPPGPVPSTPEQDNQMYYVGGSSDLSYMGFIDNFQHTANAPAGVTNPYLWHDGQVALVSVLPDGAPAPEGASIGAYSPYAGGSLRNAISEDGSRVFFTTPEGSLYVRQNGTSTIEISKSKKSVPGPHRLAEFLTASTDGRFVFFSTQEQLLDSDTNPESETGADLYRYDVQTGDLIRVSEGPNADGGFWTLAGASEDGSYVYFSSVLTEYVTHPHAQDEVVEGYVWHNGTISHVGNTAFESQMSDIREGSVQVTADGKALAFGSNGAQLLSGEEPQPGGAAQLYLYNAVADTLNCVSCRRDGHDPVGPAMIPCLNQSTNASSLQAAGESHVLSDDGKRVFFTSPDPLVAADTNENLDAYEYVNGRQYLISSGLSKFESKVLNASSDGSTVFFKTLDRLVRRDGDEGVDLYAARVGGGFSEPPPLVPCTGESCRTGTTSPPNESGAATQQFSGPGNADQRAAQKKAKKKKKARNKKKAKKRASKSKGASKRSLGK